MWWESKGCTSSIQCDNWTNFDPLFMHHLEIQTCHEKRDVGDFLNEEGWDFPTMLEKVSQYMVEHIRKNMGKAQLMNVGDKAWWTKISTC